MTYFWDNVHIPSDAERCWEWHGQIGAGGYGYFKGADRKASPLRAHRLAYVLRYGAIPEGRYVLHRCDNRVCVNPRHLFLGTHQENMDDMLTKGRQARGEKQHLAKLTEDQARSIFNDARTLTAIAADYGVSINAVWGIRHKRTWRHIHAPGPSGK